MFKLFPISAADIIILPVIIYISLYYRTRSEWKKRKAQRRRLSTPRKLIIWMKLSLCHFDIIINVYLFLKTGFIIVFLW